MISQEKVKETVCQLFKEAVTILPADVESSLRKAFIEEEDEIALLNLKAILDNIKIAKENGIPLCQDTGLPIVFVKMGNIKVENLYQGIIEGVKKATSQVPLRPNVVDPISRENTGDNTGKMIPQIDLELVDGDFLEITVMPKGFGSENNNSLKMGLPGEGLEGVRDFVVETVIRAGGKPCPPIVVGVGIGGSSDLALKLAKKALLKKIGERNENQEIAEMEEIILEEINKTGIGPMGLGGKTTALDVKIETAHTHTAGLPIGVCIQCWASRHATAILEDK
ncbi:MAG TPA: fumarate hydratase [Methanothermobacter sp.]|nr:fumarate hydratase [Methanothermobacter sp. MT-2]HHW04481.1 fumarate hydratase [Methanothermobacter sp.]HOK73043.1 fumarate hydratase [Methanothermobacter sp.]HOL69349.1 fumarate hydratase [Methanothermobacter sp.]HPQ04567.1 fumarate hydratase [Methanothermobacter sp.]